MKQPPCLAFPRRIYQAVACDTKAPLWLQPMHCIIALLVKTLRHWVKKGSLAGVMASRRGR